MVLEPMQADYLFAMLGGQPRSAPAGASGAPSSSSLEAHARKLAAGIAQARRPAAAWAWGRSMDRDACMHG